LKFGQWLGFLCLAIALLILWQVRQMLLLIFAAVIVATALNGLVRRLQRAGLRRQAAVPIVLGIALLITILFVGLIIPPFINQFSKLVELIPRATTQLLDRLEDLRVQAPPWVMEQWPDPTAMAQQLPPLLRNVLRNSVAFFSNSLTALVETLLVVILAIMLLASPQAYRRSFLKLFPSFYRRRADEILVKCEVALGNWMAGLVISSSFVGAMSFTGLWILRVDLVLAHALLAGLLNFIPNIGPTLSIIFPLTVALLDAPWKAVAVVILYFIIQQAESYWITPTIMAQQVSLLPAVTLAAQIFFATCFGFLGLLLALPLTVVAKTWIGEALIKDILDQWGSRESDRPVFVDEAIDDAVNGVVDGYVTAGEHSVVVTSAPEMTPLLPPPTSVDDV
jgi:predicted PurR-regulated permease PerM